MFKMFSFFSTFTFLVLLYKFCLACFGYMKNGLKFGLISQCGAKVKNEITLWNSLEQTIITILNCDCE